MRPSRITEPLVRGARPLLRRLPAGDLTRGVVTLVTGTTVSQAILVVTAPILTRIYSPSDVGTFGVAFSIMSILVTMTALRYDAAVALPGTDEDAANVLALAVLTCLVVSLVSAVALLVVGPWLVSVLGVAALAPFVALIALDQLAGGVMSSFTNWAVRTRSFREIATSRMTQSVTVVAAQIGLGFAGLGAFGLLVGDVIGRTTGTLRLARAAWATHRLALRQVSIRQIRAAARRYRRFPIYSSGSALVNALGVEAPLLLLVAVYGDAVGGQYALAQRIVALPVTLVATAVGQVFYSEGARLVRDRPADLRQLYGRTTRSLTLVAVGPGLLLAVLAPILAAPVFGEAWQTAGWYVTILAPMYVLQLVTSPTGGLLDILERQDLHAIREVLRLVLVGGAIAVAAILRLPAIAAVAILSVAGCLSYVAYGLFSRYALLRHRAHEQQFTLATDDQEGREIRPDEVVPSSPNGRHDHIPDGDDSEVGQGADARNG